MRPMAAKFTSTAEARAPARSTQSGNQIDPAYGHAKPPAPVHHRDRRTPGSAAYRPRRSRWRDSRSSRRRHGRDAGHFGRPAGRRQLMRCRGRFRRYAADRTRRSRRPSTQRRAQKPAPSARSGRSEDIFVNAGAFAKHPSETLTLITTSRASRDHLRHRCPAICPIFFRCGLNNPSSGGFVPIPGHQNLLTILPSCK